MVAGPSHRRNQNVKSMDTAVVCGIVSGQHRLRIDRVGILMARRVIGSTSINN